MFGIYGMCMHACIKSVFVDDCGPRYLLLSEFYHGRFLETTVTIVVIEIHLLIHPTLLHPWCVRLQV